MANVERKSLLTLIELLPPVKRKPRMGLFQCECGNTTVVREGEVRALKILSCGCWSSKRQRELHLKHGLSKHPLYGIWKAMKERCHNPDNWQYPDYGGRGITVCEEWLHDFEVFFNWAMSNGWGKGLCLDKDILSAQLGKTVSQYSPETCSFVTRKQNNNNKRDVKKCELNGQIKTIAEWAELYNVPGRLVRERMRRFGWDIQKALTHPVGMSKFQKGWNEK